MQRFTTNHPLTSLIRQQILGSNLQKLSIWFPSQMIHLCYKQKKKMVCLVTDLKCLTWRSGLFFCCCLILFQFLMFKITNLWSHQMYCSLNVWQKYTQVIWNTWHEHFTWIFITMQSSAESECLVFRVRIKRLGGVTFQNRKSQLRTFGIASFGGQQMSCFQEANYSGVSPFWQAGF